MKTIAFAACCMLLTVSLKAWQPPIGIPAPNWPDLGNPIELPTPAKPDDWKSNKPGYYYVKSGGTNEGNGYPESPRGSIPIPAPAGSKIFIDGTYDVNHRSWLVRCEGTSKAPVWIISANPEAPCKITGGFAMHGANTYTIFENIHWDKNYVEIAPGVDHVCFRNGSLKGTGTIDGKSAGGNSGWMLYQPADWSNPTEHLVFYNMDTSLTGDWLVAEGDPDRHGMAIQPLQRDIWVVDCKFSYGSGCAVQIVSYPSATDGGMAQRIYLGRNTAHSYNQSAFWSKRSLDCVFSQNTVYGIRRDNPESNEMGGLGCQYGPKNLWIIYNTVYDCQTGITVRSDSLLPGGDYTTSDVRIIGNLLYDIHDKIAPTTGFDNPSHAEGMCISVWGGNTTYIVNNTMDDYDAGIYCRFGQPRVISGNIFTNRNVSVEGRDMLIETETSSSNIISHNIIQEPCRVENAGKTYTTITSLNTAKGPANSRSVPSYVDRTRRNYMLAEGSKGIDDFTGTANPVYDLFSKTYGRSIAFDRNGTARPQDGKWDIGAHEFKADGVTKLAPLRPSGVGIEFLN